MLPTWTERHSAPTRPLALTYPFPIMRIISITCWLTFSLVAVSAATAGCGEIGAPPSKTDSSPNADTTVVTEGTFEGREGEDASGNYRILRIGDDNLRLILADNFSVSDGPDLYVVLSPKGFDDVSGTNVLDGDAKTLNELKAPSGSQEYDLADDLELSTFNTVAIQCIEYEHLFAAAEMD